MESGHEDALYGMTNMVSHKTAVPKALKGIKN